MVVTFPPPDNDYALRVCHVHAHTPSPPHARTHTHTHTFSQVENVRVVCTGTKRARSRSPSDSPTPASQEQEQDGSRTDSQGDAGAGAADDGDDSGSAASAESEECERWVRCTLDEGGEGEVSVHEVFWLFTQFGRVREIVARHGAYHVCMLTRDTDAVSYLRNKTVQFSKRTCAVRCQPCAVPALHGASRSDYAAVNAGLRDLLLAASAEDVADGFDVFFKANGWAPRDFMWGRWVVGDGWLEPRQEAELQRRMPARVVSDDKLLHVGNLWDGAQPENVYRLASLYGHIQNVSRIVSTPKTTYCLLRFKRDDGAAAFMANVANEKVGERRLKVDVAIGNTESKGKTSIPKFVQDPSPTPLSTRVLLRGFSDARMSEYAHRMDLGDRPIFSVPSGDHRSRGFAVEFASKSDAALFVAANNLKYFRNQVVKMWFYHPAAAEGEEATLKRFTPTPMKDMSSGGGGGDRAPPAKQRRLNHQGD